MIFDGPNPNVERLMKCQMHFLRVDNFDGCWYREILGFCTKFSETAFWETLKIMNFRSLQSNPRMEKWSNFTNSMTTPTRCLKTSSRIWSQRPRSGQYLSVQVVREDSRIIPRVNCARLDFKFLENLSYVVLHALAVTKGIGNVIEKWEFTFRILQQKWDKIIATISKPNFLLNFRISKDTPGSILSELNRCHSFDDLTPETDANFDINNLSKLY